MDQVTINNCFDIHFKLTSVTPDNPPIVDTSYTTPFITSSVNHSETFLFMPVISAPVNMPQVLSPIYYILETTPTKVSQSLVSTPPSSNVVVAHTLNYIRVFMIEPRFQYIFIPTFCLLFDLYLISSFTQTILRLRFTKLKLILYHL